MMKPVEFALWLNGARDMMGEAPTAEQWATVTEKLGHVIGYLAAQRLLERAEDQIKEEEARNKRYNDLLKEEIQRQKYLAGEAQLAVVKGAI